MDKPFRLLAGLRCIAAPAHLAATLATHDHLVARLEIGVTAGDHLAGEINARNMRVIANKTAKAIETQPVLVVDVGIFHRDIDVAIIGKL